MENSENYKTYNYEVGEEFNKKRVDVFLVSCPDILSRSFALKLLKSGFVRLNSKVVKPSFLVETGQQLEIKIPIKTSSGLLSYDFPIDIVYEDNDIIIVDKPSGLVVHPAHGHQNDTLVNVLVFHCKDLSLGFAENRPGLVHRLDKDTSGLIVIAKNNAAQIFLADQFKNRTVKRSYRALVFGEPKESKGRIESILIRHKLHRKKFVSIKDEPLVSHGDVNGKLAITNYTVIKSLNGISLVELKLETGRTHQIRIHLSEKGHAVVGDDLYGGVKRAAGLKSVLMRKHIKAMDRFALHAFELGFIHPTTKKPVHFISNWPKNLEELLQLTKIEKNWQDEL